MCYMITWGWLQGMQVCLYLQLYDNLGLCIDKLLCYMMPGASYSLYCYSYIVLRDVFMKIQLQRQAWAHENRKCENIGFAKICMQLQLANFCLQALQPGYFVGWPFIAMLFSVTIQLLGIYFCTYKTLVYLYLLIQLTILRYGP